MARRVTCEWMACVLVLAVCGWHGAFAAELPFADTEAQKDLSDMNRVRALAEAGRANSPPASAAITARPFVRATSAPR